MNHRFLLPPEPEKRGAEIRVRRGKARIQRQRSRVARRGLLGLAGPGKRVPQIVMGFGVFWVELDGFAITEQRFICAPRF